MFLVLKGTVAGHDGVGKALAMFSEGKEPSYLFTYFPCDMPLDWEWRHILPLSVSYQY